jgi:putative endonuclease
LRKISRVLIFLYLFHFKKKLPKVSKLRGEYGEWLAERFLRKKGFVFLYRNWRSPEDKRMELDLVCLERTQLVFVEVRARSSHSMINGWQSLTPKKRKALHKSARHFLRQSNRLFESYRFDVVEIDIPENAFSEYELFHHENIAILKR